MMVSEALERCPRCGEVKPRTTEHFYFARSGPQAGRVTGYCRACMRGVNAAYALSAPQREQRRRYQRAWARARRLAGAPRGAAS